MIVLSLCLCVQVPQLEARDRVCWQVVRQLAAVDLSSQQAVKQLMAAVVETEAGVA
jgi:DNA-binding FrmR family transcriptional regulator